MHGDWVIRRAGGSVFEGPFVEDQMHGDWVIRYTDGTVRYRRYENDVLVN